MMSPGQGRRPCFALKPLGEIGLACMLLGSHAAAQVILQGSPMLLTSSTAAATNDMEVSGSPELPLAVQALRTASAQGCKPIILKMAIKDGTCQISLPAGMCLSSVYLPKSATRMRLDWGTHETEGENKPIASWSRSDGKLVLSGSDLNNVPLNPRDTTQTVTLSLGIQLDRASSIFVEGNGEGDVVVFGWDSGAHAVSTHSEWFPAPSETHAVDQHHDPALHVRDFDRLMDRATDSITAKLNNKEFKWISRSTGSPHLTLSCTLSDIRGTTVKEFVDNTRFEVWCDGEQTIDLPASLLFRVVTKDTDPTGNGSAGPVAEEYVSSDYVGDVSMTWPMMRRRTFAVGLTYSGSQPRVSAVFKQMGTSLPRDLWPVKFRAEMTPGSMKFDTFWTKAAIVGVFEHKKNTFFARGGKTTPVFWSFPKSGVHLPITPSSAAGRLVWPTQVPDYAGRWFFADPLLISAEDWPSLDFVIAPEADDDPEPDPEALYRTPTHCVLMYTVDSPQVAP